MGTLEAIWEIIKSAPDLFGIGGAIVLAAAGYIAKHVSDLRIRRYEERMRFATSQLRDLYGPLFMLSQSNDRTWNDFRKVFRPNRPMFDQDNPLTEEEKSEYILWLETAFGPCNRKMRETIERNAHLFEGGRAPVAVLQLLSHFSDLDVVLAKLKDGLSSNVFPRIAYPKDFADNIRSEYDVVVRRYAILASKWR